MPEIGYEDDKGLILFVLNALCDVIHDVKCVYVWRIWLVVQSDSFGNEWLQLLQQRVNILINVLVAVAML